MPISYGGAQLGASAGLAMGYETGQFANYPFPNRSRITNQLSVFSYTDYTAGGSPNGFLFGDTEASGAGYNFGLYSNATGWQSFVKTGGSGASAGGGSYSQRRRFAHAFTYDGANIRNYVGGAAAGTTAKTGNVDQGGFSLNINRWNSSSVHAGRFFVGAIWGRALSADEIASLSANPWQLFEPAQRVISIAATVSVYLPGADVSGSWTPVGTATVAAALADASTSNWGESLDLATSQTITWTPPLPAGTWDIPIVADRTGASGQTRIVCLDSGGASVGASAWQALTATQASYTLSVTTTATATQFRIEVQP